ncbi:MAG: hypothetical protein Q9165_000991 [Trypethelium subeluteriae]
MPKPRRNIESVAESTLYPPPTLPPTHSLARVVKASGNNLYTVQLPSQQTLLVELPSRFRSTIWIKRNGYVVVNTEALAGRDNKLDGEIVNIVGDEKAWRRMGYWPEEFKKVQVVGVRGREEDEEEEEESNVGKMPPSEDEDEDD